jgi:uncharacterized protein with von Willebrand factor type A (vWA) domain
VAADLAVLAARFGAALRAEGVAVGADRSARFTQAIMVVRPDSTAQLYRCALATLISDPAQIEVLDRVFRGVFGGVVDPAEFRGDTVNLEEGPNVTLGAPNAPNATLVASNPPNATLGTPREGARQGEGREVAVPTVGSAQERLSSQDFGELSESELAVLAELMRGFRIATPLRRSRRFRAAAGGRRIDLRQTLRRARRSGAEPLSLSRRTPREKPRRLVVLCDISGSMEAHARAMLQLLYCASGGAHAEVFTFATRLTRLTRALAARPADALRHAGELAPDWSGGTRIGCSLRDFLDTYGARGMARGAVVVIISDGWETGDPSELGEQMARLSRLAHRIVWVNPRTASARYQPLVGGMAAALPYCDDLVSAHRLDALEALTQAIAGPSGLRSRGVVVP